MSVVGNLILVATDFHPAADEALRLGRELATKLGCRLAAEVKEIARDVTEDHRAGAALERAEADQTFATADVEQRLSLAKLRAVEDPVTRLRQLHE